MSWNHRVLATEYKHKDGTIEMFFQIHEVYYNKSGEIRCHTKEGVKIGGDSVKSLKWINKQMKKCLKKPILWGDNRFPQEYKPQK